MANVLHMPQDVLQLCIDSLTVGDKFMVHGSISDEKTINMLVVTLYDLMSRLQALILWDFPL